MPLTIKLTQLKRKQKKDGTIPIYIRITENRRSRYKSTGIAVLPKYWNPNERVIRSTHKRANTLNLLLRQELRKVQKKRDDLEKNDALDLDTLKQAISSRSDPYRLINRAERYHNSLDNTERYWEWKRFGVLLNNLKDFSNGQNVRIADVDAHFIEDFQDYLLSEVGNNPNTVRRKLTSLKGFFLRLIKNKEIKNDPFTAVNKVSKQPADRLKLSHSQIEAIEGLTLQRYSNLWHTRNYFMFSFYNAGIRIGDLCTLKWGNLIDGRLKYEMRKTGGKKSIKQLIFMYRILIQYVDCPGKYLSFSSYLQPPSFFIATPDNPLPVLKPVVDVYASKNREQYVFPILQKKYENPFDLRKAIGSKNTLINRWLKKIADLANIDANISFHVSRHSFANYANRKGMDLYSISKALGHADLKTTQEYLKSFDEEKIDNSMEDVFKK